MDSRLSLFAEGQGAAPHSPPAAPRDAAWRAVFGSRQRRVLALVDLASRGEQVIRRACSNGLSGEAALLAVHVIDGRLMFEADGPCGYFLAAERFGRRVPQTARRLDLMLVRNQAAWAESAVLVADGPEPLTTLIERWQPDLIVSDRRSARQPWAAPALRAAGCRIELIDVDRAPSPRATRVFELLKGERIMTNSLSEQADAALARQVAKTSAFGLATLLLYLVLFANEAAILQLSAQGRWYFLLPIVIAFVISYFHGAFTAGFWDALGIKASGKKG